MPKLREAAALIAGHIIDIETTRDYTTKEADGVRVLINTGDGFASVKLKTENAAQVKHDYGTPVMWYIRAGAYARGEQGEVFSQFVSVATPGDLDKLASHARNVAKPTQAASV